MLLIIILLIIAAVTGVLWRVLEIAAGVALGIFLAAVLLSAASYFLIRWQYRRRFRPPPRHPDRFR